MPGPSAPEFAPALLANRKPMVSGKLLGNVNRFFDRGEFSVPHKLHQEYC